MLGKGLERTGDGEYFSGEVVSRSAGEKSWGRGEWLVKTAPVYTVSNLSGPIKLESDINSDPHSAKPHVSSLS